MMMMMTMQAAKKKKGKRKEKKNRGSRRLAAIQTAIGGESNIRSVPTVRLGAGSANTRKRTLHQKKITNEMINQAVPSFTVRRHFFCCCRRPIRSQFLFFLASPVFAVLFFFRPWQWCFFFCLFVCLKWRWSF